jgi:hypothetical protein
MQDKPCPYMTVNLICKCFMCSDCSTTGHSPLFLTLGVVHSLKPNKIEIRPVNNPQVISMDVKGRVIRNNKHPFSQYGERLSGLVRR